MTEVAYSQAPHPLCEGRLYRNPRYFAGVEEGATLVVVVGDWPTIVEAYTAAGVPVAVAPGLETAVVAPAPPPRLNSVGVTNPASVEVPDGWRELDWPELREIARQLSTAPVLNTETAVEIIDAELERRARDHDGDGRMGGDAAAARDGITKAEVMADLDAMSVEYDPKARKAELMALRAEALAKVASANGGGES